MLKKPEVIEDVTLGLLLKYLKTLGCSECGWNKASCDVHHIVSRAEGGSDLLSNLTYVCPNCHRLAHSGLLSKFVTIGEQVEVGWREFFEVRREMILQRFKEAAKKKQNISKHNSVRRDIRNSNAPEIVKQLRESNIDFQKYGWAKKAAPIVGIAPQKVRTWIEEFAPDLVANAFKRIPLVDNLVKSLGSDPRDP